MGRKTWLALPKVEGANRTAKLRDVDLGNTSRRILAKMLYNVLHEVGVTELHEAQQAFLQSRDILNNTTELLRVFGDAVTRENVKGGAPCGEKEKDRGGGGLGERVGRDTHPLIMLLLDCSKGYNRMKRDWIVECLEKAGAPKEIIRITEALLVNLPIYLY